MRLNKKELKSIAQTFRFWQDAEKKEADNNYFNGMRATLSQIGVLKQVQNEIFKQDHMAPNINLIVQN